MKVRLTGIMEETIVQPQIVEPGAGAMPAVQEKITIARFETPGLPPYYTLVLPAEAVGDAKIGDEFNVFVERVKK